MSANLNWLKKNLVPENLDPSGETQLRRKARKYSVVLFWGVAFIFPIWTLLDYYYAPKIWFGFLLLRVALVGSFFIVHHLSRKYNWRPEVIVHISFAAMTLQLSLLVNMIGLNVLNQYYIAFSTVFIAFNMLVLWKPIHSLIQQIIAGVFCVGLFFTMSKFNFAEVLSNGGLMLLTLSTLSTLLARTRYNLERKEIIARSIIRSSNEQLRLQNKQIRLQKEEIEIKNRSITKQNDELKRMNQKATEASRIKDEFLATMSHELRTPLNAVIGTTHLLLQENPKEDQLDNLNTLHFSAENLLALVNDILDYSKIEAGKIEFEEIDYSLKNLVGSVCSAMEYNAKEKGIQLECSNLEFLPNTVIGDPTRMSQILNNLVNNAIKFTNKGKVSLRISNLEETDDKCNLLFEVIDTGIGIPEHKFKTIFEKFTQSSSNTTRKYGGTGLGLPICSKLLRLMQSELKLESKEGEGSRFFFTVVMKKGEIKKVTQKNEFEVQDFKGLEKVRILVAEDNMINQRLISKFLKKWDATFEIAENGAIAVDMIEKQEFDLVLMDLQMPEMDGFEATKIIRNHSNPRVHEMPIVALTASALLEVQSEILEVGMNDCVTKPFNPKELYRKIARYTLKSTINN